MNKAWLISAIAFTAAAMVADAAFAAAQCAKQSPAHTVALLELYTSEGCDSCPPADQWLNRLGQADASDSLVPLALHVDYWDRLGWKDRFASPRYAERQGDLARLNRSRAVYTPGVFMNLEELRVWRSASGFRDAVRAINARPALADIRIELASPSPAQLAIKAQFKIRPGAARQPQAYVAVYENGLSTDVKAGENRGVTLRHDYVVREWIGPLDPAGGLERTVPIPRDWNPKALGVAAFVQDSGGVLQATALPLCAKN